MIYYTNTVISKKSVPEDVITPKQIHSDNVYIVLDNLKYSPTADALVTKKRGIKIGILTADCVPIIYYDDINMVIGISHNGWKGMIGNLTTNTLQAMIDSGAEMSNIKCVLGPAIGGCCYNIFGARKHMYKSHPIYKDDTFLVRKSDQDFLDLRIFAKVYLKSLGILSRNIHTSEICTCCNKKFPSYKRNDYSDNTILSWVTIC